MIVLVITIIVLLILAGVTIQTLTGDNGLLQKAQTAKEEQDESKELELIKLAVMSAAISENGEISNTEELINQLRNNGINVQENQIEKQEDGWVYNKDSGIIYYIYKNGEVSEKKEEYRYIRMTISKLRSNNYDSCIQLADIRIYDENKNLFSYPNSTSIQSNLATTSSRICGGK